MSIAGLGDAAAADSIACGVFTRHDPGVWLISCLGDGNLVSEPSSETTVTASSIAFLVDPLADVFDLVQVVFQRGVQRELWEFHVGLDPIKDTWPSNSSSVCPAACHGAARTYPSDDERAVDPF